MRAYIALPKRREEVAVLGKQMLRAGTSVASHAREASRARSDAEFWSKLDGLLQEADETQLWISDQEGKRLYTFDMTVSPPVQTGHLDLIMGGHGWVCFSLDGTYGYSHTPDVFDVKSRKKVATLKDEHGKPFGSSKFIEVHVDEGKVVKVSNEFGLGRVHAGK